MLDKWIAAARKQGASDLHLEAGLPPAVRIRGRLRMLGEPVPARTLMAAAKAQIPDGLWPSFVARRSFDTSVLIAGVPCRLNIFQTTRGVGMAVRLLATVVPTIRELNLHPELAELAELRQGLVLISGSTGAGKSSTLAALIEHINRTDARHIITLEQPVEYHHRPQQAFIRQREVGRDTPSFEQGILDALREDPDVLVVGEMRRRETMQLTLDLAETGHLVFATVHASRPTEALQRIVNAFDSDTQAGVGAQLASCLGGVVCQSLSYDPQRKIRVPELEILRATPAARANIRDRQFHKLAHVMETGAQHGMWTRERYKRWLANRADFFVRPGDVERLVATDPPRTTDTRLPPLGAAAPQAEPASAQGARAATSRVIEIEDDAPDIDELIAKLEGR